jgi:hypothetical protein
MTTTLDTIATTFADLARGAVAALARPSRDDLARELATLQASPPETFIDLCAPAPEPAHVACAGCREAAQEAAESRARYAAHGARVDVLKSLLFRLSWGGPDETDAAGAELAAFRREVRRAADENARRKWGELDEEVDPQRPGRTVTTWTPPKLLAEVGRDLQRLGSLACESGPMPWMGTAELLAAIEQGRAELRKIMTRSVRARIEPEVAERAHIPRVDPFDREGTDGLTPAVDTPSIIGGTVRFGRRR